MRFIALAGLLTLTGLLQGCFPNAFSGQPAGALVSQDRRAEEARRDDREIETKAIDMVYKNTKVFMHVNATSFNRKVLLSGEVPDEVTKAELEKRVAAIPLVSGVNNELVVGENSSMLSRSNDSRLTASVKIKFVADGRFDSNVINVFTEKGTVFLRGIVYPSEAEAAAEAASAVSGVKRVVKLFERMN